MLTTESTASNAVSPITIELGPIAARVSRSLHGEVPMDRIETLLRQLLDEEFSEARVTAFLPIFLHRVAVESLRREVH
jgi:hypothetical protein